MSIRKQKGVALPVALILFVVMLIGALYLARSAGSSAGAVANLSYQRSISKAADAGLLTANTWLGSLYLGVDRTPLFADLAAQGYRASYAFTPSLSPQDPAFWSGSTTITAYTDTDGSPVRVEYIIYRMCSLTGSPTATGNLCIKSVARPDPVTGGNGVQYGESLDLSTGEGQNKPGVQHYLITARVVNAARGTSVINQMVVTMGA